MRSYGGSVFTPRIEVKISPAWWQSFPDSDQSAELGFLHRTVKNNRKHENEKKKMKWKRFVFLLLQTKQQKKNWKGPR